MMLGTVQATVEGPVREVKDAIATANAWSDAVAQELANELPSYAATAAAPHSKADRFWIDPQDLLRVQRQARDRNLVVVGIYHSHPDQVAVPSECDRTIAWSDYSYLILAVRQGQTVEVRSWTLDEQRQFQMERMGGSTPELSYS